MREEVGKKESYRDRMRRSFEEKESSNGGTSILKLPEGMEWWKPKDGPNLINILPYEVSIANHPDVNQGDYYYEKTIFVHYLGKKSYICPKTINKPCSVCEHRSTLLRDKADPDLIESFRAKKRQIFNVEDIENAPGKIKIWEYAHFYFGGALEQEVNRLVKHPKRPRPEIATFCHPDDGFSLELTFKAGSFKGHDVKDCTHIEFVEREPLTDAMLKTLNLDTILNVLDNDKLKAIFLGTGDEPIDDNDNPFIQEEPTPTTRRKVAEETPAPVTRRRAAAVEPKPEPEEEEAEPEPEPVPARRRGAVAEAPAKAKTPVCGFGGTWGKDCEKLDACNDECPTNVWEKCLEEQKKMKAAVRK